MDYTKLEEITVKTQAELDMIPEGFAGRIYVEFGKPWDRASIKKKYHRSVEARGNSSVEARGNSSVVARGNSSVVAWENSSVVARGNSSVVAWGNSSVEAWENSSVVAWGNSSVEAWENSSVEAWGNVQVDDRLSAGRIQISGNARAVHMPKNITEFMDFYGIKNNGHVAAFYKAVRLSDGKYVSDRDRNFVYEIGASKEEECDGDTNRDCSYGIHISHLAWALSYGRNWDDLAILEVTTKVKDIVMPEDAGGKVRTCKVDVIREVPLDECGLFGKILARRNAK